MNIQPHSALLRKWVPRPHYFQLMREQRHQSFIGLPLNQSNTQSISQRIAELEALEKIGFVYVGEKNWLLSYLAGTTSSRFIHYDQWVAHNFETFLGLNFEISQAFNHLDSTMWQAELDALDLLLGFVALQNPAFLGIDELDIFVGGNDDKPHPSHMIKAFEFLHNLEYALSTVSYKPQGNREVSVTGIDVSNPVDPSRWELNVISDYGSEWDVTIINGVAWQFKGTLGFSAPDIPADD